MLYAVFKQSIYRHECAGIFSTPKKALEAAKETIRTEPDDYHYCEVISFQLDILITERGGGLMKRLKEHLPIYQVERNKQGEIVIKTF